MKKIIDLGAVALSSSGVVKGTEDVLEALTEREIESVSGALFGDEYWDQFSSNDGCSNTKGCKTTTNTACSNTYMECGPNNSGCKTPIPE